MRALLPVAMALLAMAQDPSADALHLRFLRSYDAERFAAADSACRAGAGRFPGDARFVGCRLLLLASPYLSPDPGRAWRLADSAVALRATPEQRVYTRLETASHVAAVLARAGLSDSARRVLRRIPDSVAVDPTHFLAYHQALAWRIVGDSAESARQMRRYLQGDPARRAAPDTTRP